MFILPSASFAISALRASCGRHCHCATMLETYGDLFFDDPEVEGEIAVMAMNLAGFVPVALHEANESPPSVMADLHAIATPPFPSRLAPEVYGLYQESGLHA